MWAKPGVMYKTSGGQLYLADKNGALRRRVLKPTLAERKAIKRVRRDAQRKGETP